MAKTTPRKKKESEKMYSSKILIRLEDFTATEFNKIFSGR
jgi:hypothetical protein